MADYLPQSDAEFSTWLHNFTTFAGANLATLGMVAADLTPVSDGADEFGTDLAKKVAADAQAAGATLTKDQTRTKVEGLVRPLVGRLQTTKTVTDAHRAALRITVRTTTRAATETPNSRPVATIDTSQRLRQTISFVDELTPTSKAKPDGVSGCEVWVKVGGATPVDPSELHYLATDTRTPYTAEFEGDDGGKMAYYMLRWVNTRGERGPWSQTVGATITG